MYIDTVDKTIIYFPKYAINFTGAYTIPRGRLRENVSITRWRSKNTTDD